MGGQFYQSCVTEVCRWLPIPGYEAFYEVSDDGRVASLRYRNGPRRKELQLTPHVKSQHMLVALSDRKHPPKTYSVHQLVMMAFKGPAPDGHEVRHLDGDPQNNRLGNLAYGTRKQNIEDRRRHGVLAQGERHASACLTRAQVIEIRRRCAAGESQSSVAESLGRPRSTIASVVQRVSWKHV